MNNIKKNSGNSDEALNNVKCYNCDEFGHYKRNCPYPKKQRPSSNKDSSKKRKRAYTATLDDSDSDSDSSNKDQKTENQNIGFTVAIDDLENMELK